MGWDAYAKTRRRKAFREAAERIKKEVGTVDGLLKNGGLDCRMCAGYLTIATNHNTYDDKGWSVNKVQYLNEIADWSFDIGIPEYEWAKQSAKAFLEICAKYKCSIEFSF